MYHLALFILPFAAGAVAVQQPTLVEQSVPKPHNGPQSLLSFFKRLPADGTQSYPNASPSNASNIWALTNPSSYLPARSDMTTWTDAKYVYATGIENYTYTYTVSNTVMRTADGDVWTNVTDGPWQPRAYSASTVLNVNGTDVMIVTAGGACTPPFVSSICQGYNWYDDMWVSTDAVTWNLVIPDAGSPVWGARGGHTLDNLNGQLVLTGGLNNTVEFNDVWISNDLGKTWTSYDAPWACRSFHATAVFPLSSGSEAMVMAAGGALHGVVYQDVWLTYDGITWSQLALPPWTGRFAHTLTFLQSSSLFVLTGGYCGDANLNTIANSEVWVAKLNESASTSKSAHTSDAIIAPNGGISLAWEQAPNATWSPRAFHSAVILPLTDQMIVSGGWKIIAIPDAPYFSYFYYADTWTMNATALLASVPAV
jgi:hypothetical protein